jgi:hypothetical protein
MNKENNQHWLAARLAAITFTVMVGAVCAILPATAAMAQKLAPEYKVGDRVEIDVITQGNPANAVWKKATVSEVNVDGQIYFFEVDAPAGKIPQVIGIPIRSPQQYIRPLQGADPGPKTLDQKKHEAADGTVLADREILDCDFKQPPARNGSAPSPELTKKLIRCLWEKPAQPELDGAITIDISAFQMGAPRKWVPLQDLGSGKLETIIYPIRATWTMKTFYRTRTVVQTNESVFNCYVDAFNKWECGLGQRIKDGDIKEIRVR